MDDDPAAVARVVGARIRMRRNERGMRLKDLAEAAGLKQPFLSQLERGLASPSMHSLYRLARALDVTPGDLMPPAESVPGARVVRASEGRRVESTDSNASFVRLIVGDGHHPFELSEIEVDESRNNREWFENPNAAATYVIEGRLDVEVGSSETYSLSAGDSIFYPQDARSRWTALGRKPTRLLHVVARTRQV
ncbi:helix-turn-helix domain-containing protein [Rhodococcus pyridinivorans]